MNPKNEVKILELGLIDYKQAWDYQTQLFEQNLAIKKKNREEGTDFPTYNYLIICQHPHVYTLGKSGKRENLLVTEYDLENFGANYYEINRGGDITYHGPGQLVVYPIIDLELFFTDIHKYMRYLEEAVIQVCSNYDIKAGRYDGFTGVWIVDDPNNLRKICAMGVKTSRWITMHGLAFNINPDLSYFEKIVPCGISDKSVTSLSKELGRDVNLSEVIQGFKVAFANVFDCNFVV